MRAYHIPCTELKEMVDACFYGYAVMQSAAAKQPADVASTYHATSQRLRQIGGMLMRLQTEFAPIAFVAGMAEIPDEPVEPMQPVAEMAVAA